MRLGEEHIFNNKSLTLITKKKIMKKYEKPQTRLHMLKTAQMIAESFTVPAKENPQSQQEDDGMQGFTVRDGWE